MDPDVFADALQNIAVNEFDIPAIDQRKVQETAATSIALGLMAADGLHYRAGGQSIMAKMVFDALMFSRAMGY
jgi:lysophospholipase L1-like esterase